MKVYVICCNDSAEYAVIGDHDKAIAKKQELREAYYEKNKGCFRDKADYAARCAWYINLVSGE